MAPTLLHRIFSRRAGAAASSPAGSCSSSAARADRGAAPGWVSSDLAQEQIRLIVYQDCEKRGRQVLFDSKAVRPVDASAQNNGSDSQTKPTSYTKCCQANRSGACTIRPQGSPSPATPAEREAQPRFQYTRPASDVNMLGEMMFGSVAMSYRGSTLKIHFIRSPPQLMISKVFSARVGGSTGSTNTLQDSFEYISQDAVSGKSCPSHSGLGGYRSGSSIGLVQLYGGRPPPPDAPPLRLVRSASFFAAHSTPVDMPSRGHNEDGDSGIARSASLSSLLVTPLPSPNSSFSSSCASSYQRRWLRSQTTSLENGPVPRGCNEETFSLSDETCGSNPAMVRRKKIAVSTIFSLPETDEESCVFQDFFFSHFPLFESHMNKLKTAIEKAMISCRKVAESSQRVQLYLCRVMDALGEFRMTICSLYRAPRVPEPVWLTMTSQSAGRAQLCRRFIGELTALAEQASRNQFLSALLTAILTYHLAWVPTVMPSDHSPVRVFSEKHTSRSVDLLAKSHPYNPLWAQLGDLYGAIGSPVRLSRTVVLGRRRELVQRVLYVLTYFIRCSHLQENMPTPGAAPAAGPMVGCEARPMPGSPVFHTTLERGEVEESEYVVVSVRSDRAEPDGPSDAPRADSCSDSPDTRPISPPAAAEPSPAPCREAAVSQPVAAQRDFLLGLSLATPADARLLGREASVSSPQAVPLLGPAAQHSPLLHRVKFRIGSSESPDSDLESRHRDLDRSYRRIRDELDREGSDVRLHSDDAHSVPDGVFPSPCCLASPSAPCCGEPPGALLAQGRDTPSSRADRNAASPAQTRRRRAVEQGGQRGEGGERPWPAGGGASPAEREAMGHGKRMASITGVLGDIPRNKSSDSALGDSGDEGGSHSQTGASHGEHRQEEYELPLPRMETVSKPHVTNFGHSLLGGYCPQYLPDFVLHGAASDERLRQRLTADLDHAMLHPALDEPIAEAVCIVADTDKWTVQVATSQRRVMDSSKLGKDVLVSSLVSGLLLSILQLSKLGLSPDFVIMHLEDRLQEIYFKSKMLSEYLKGQTRVHVRELGVVLGIESNDLPLLAAVASTHSPYVAQILL
ncbi:folliculin-interacting protein 2 isoform X2 [Amia ocellicauda]|uniref:folliculin-interacting protein 2 isoform X2 n=1 Tax=Amia ocellicauda TaxID=2972642 RepID=UPI003463EDDB